jgi:hypothetical protein
LWEVAIRGSHEFTTSCPGVFDNFAFIWACERESQTTKHLSKPLKAKAADGADDRGSEISRR